MKLFHWTRWNRSQLGIGKTYHSPEVSLYWQGKQTKDWLKASPVSEGLNRLISLLDVFDQTKKSSEGIRRLADHQLYSGELLKEYVFEEVRAAEFDQAPSRKSCLFCFDTAIDPAEYFRAMKISTQDRLLLEIEPVPSQFSSVRASLSLLNCNTSTVLEMKEKARAYWKGTDQLSMDSEVLLTGAFRILAISDPPA